MIQLTLTLKMTTAHVVETSVIVPNNNNPIHDYVHLDDQTQPTFEILETYAWYGLSKWNFFIHYYIWPLICNFSWIFSTFFCVLLRYWLALLIASNSLKVTPSKKTTIWQIVKYFPWSVLKWNHEPQASGFTAKFWTFWSHFYGQYEYRTMENVCPFVYTITLMLFEGKTKTNWATITSFSWPVLLSTDHSSRPISARENAQLLWNSCLITP